MALLVFKQHVLAICMVGDALGTILWAMPCSASQAPMARAPMLSQPPVVCNRFGAEVSGNKDDIRGPRRSGSTEDLLPSLLGPTPHEQDLQATEATESMWSRISSVCLPLKLPKRELFVSRLRSLSTMMNSSYLDWIQGSVGPSRRGFERIYEFFTRLIHKGSLDPNSRHFPPPPPPGGGGCAGPPP